MTNLKFSNQPVAWLTFISVVATIAIDVINKQVDIGTAVNSLIVAAGGVIMWRKVTPIEKLTEVIDET